MSDKKEIIYAGSGKQITGQYGTFRAVTVCLTDLPKEHIFEYNGKKYIKLNVSDKREADQYGKDVSISVNTFKPDEQAQNNNAAPQQSAPQSKEADDDLPF